MIVKNLLLGSLVLVTSMAAGVLQAPTTHAVTPPDNCFAFAAGTVTDYYDNEGNNILNPVCPRNVDIPSTIGGQPVAIIGDSAFYDKQLTAVSIPSSVTSIGAQAFYSNLLTSLVIPNSVTTIGSYAFGINQLTSLTLGTGLTTIADYVFETNKLAAVIVPDNITSVDPLAFVFQGVDRAAFIGGDLTTFMDTYYTRLYTANPANPNSLVDAQTVVNESGLATDINNDGDQLDDISFGGHLINPAQATISYKDEASATLQVDDIVTGTGLANYIANDNNTNDLTRYYRLGSSHSFTAPTITGYSIVTPTSPHNIVLAAADGNNAFTFVYSNPAAPGGSSSDDVPGAPNTGVASEEMSGAVVLLFESLLIVSTVVLGRRLYRQ